MGQLIYQRFGHCPICESSQWFKAYGEWYRDLLYCEGCGSIPRERALALVMQRRRPHWRSERIHECSPAARGISLKMSGECKNYTATQFIPGLPLGTKLENYQNENLECTTFVDRNFDIVVSLDVMEHVNEPKFCFQDMYRTLDSGGVCFFTVPTEKGQLNTERLARFLPNGGEEHYVPPEYHGNPVSEKGALVTFRYGYEFAKEITEYAPFSVTVYRFQDHLHGIIGDYTEVYECQK